MLPNKDIRQSASIFGPVLNSPLYDGDCSPTAREYLAAGDIDSAVAEWRRLAELGSGRARCILAYLSFKGTLLSPADTEEAKRIALTAVAGERGYANYLLGSISLKERRIGVAAKYFAESAKAGFSPAFVAAALLLLRGRGASKERKQSAINLIRRAMKDGHIPAHIALSAAYASGKVGLARRVLGIAMFPVAIVRYLVGARYHVFSIDYFQIVLDSKYPLFNAESISNIQQRGSRKNARSPLTSLRWLNAAAALVTAFVIVSRPAFTFREYESHTGSAIVAWILLAAWPFGLSTLAAPIRVAQGKIARLVHVSLIVVFTAVGCDAYSGAVFGTSSNGWVLTAISMVLALLLLTAAGAAIQADQPITATYNDNPPHRSRVLWAHLILGLVAATAVFARQEVWHLEYLRHSAIDVVARAMVAALPYGVCAAFSWPLVTTRVWRPWIYIGILISGTVVAVGTSIGASGWSTELFAQVEIAVFQLVAFILAADWALDGDEWYARAQGGLYGLHRYRLSIALGYPLTPVKQRSRDDTELIYRYRG